MSTISPIEIFIALFIGMGPIKALLVYIAMTEGLSQETKRLVARRTVLVAGAGALAVELIITGIKSTGFLVELLK